ncbi:MAG: hypothetical protein O7G83_22360 [Proteobacteria bacterium]|nr:hypothetical protein [Pseudomonadota bacterium]
MQGASALDASKIKVKTSPGQTPPHKFSFASGAFAIIILEDYIIVAVPAWLTAVAFVPGPPYARTGAARIVTLVLPATLVLHDLFRGVSYIQSKESDYTRQKAAWPRADGSVWVRCPANWGHLGKVG